MKRIVKKIGYFIALSRPRTCFISVFSFLLGVKVTEGSWSIGMSLALLSSYLVPSLANFHNAMTDGKEDSFFLSGREKALKDIGESSTKKILLIISVLLFLLLSLSSLVNLLLAPIGIVLLFAYSREPWRFKAVPSLGAVIFSLVGVFPFLGGNLMGSWWSDIKWSSFNVVITLLILMLMIAKFFIKNLPDYEPDKSASLRTSATIFSEYKKAALVAVILEIFAYLAVLTYDFLTFKYLTELVIKSIVTSVCIFHSLRFLQSYNIRKLNNAMKWDMFCSTLFLAAWSFPISKENSLLAWGISVAVWISTMFISLDSREGRYVCKGNNIK